MTMSSATPFPHKLQYLCLGTSCIAISTIFFLFSPFLYIHKYNCTQLFGEFKVKPFDLKWSTPPENNSTVPINNFPTNISHIKFIIVSSKNTWNFRKPYIESWWLPNQTRGNVFLDSTPAEESLPWPPSCPPFQVNEDLNKLRVFPKLRFPAAFRIFRSILETFKLGDDENIRWYVMGDDDTLFFVHNLVDVLSKYDHTKYHYIGMNSEAIKSNMDFTFDMAYGGAGYALSYSLVEQALVPAIDECTKRYPFSRTSDELLSFCLSDFGIDLTTEKGFHQIDVHGDISGLLSSHPQSPVVSLHHFDGVNPIFPSKNQYESVNHLMEAAKLDQSRLLQQTICYHRATNWSFSVSWGYSAHIYENIFPRSFLKLPIETFWPFKRSAKPPFYIFKTRFPSGDPCEAPHVFFLESVKNVSIGSNNQVLTTYKRAANRNLPPCSSSGNHSADSITQIRLLSPATRRKQAAKVECCNVEYVAGLNVADIKLRPCMNGEVIA